MSVLVRANILGSTETNTLIFAYYKDYLNVFLNPGDSA